MKNLAKMKNKEQINYFPFLKRALELSIKIQNKGIATIFFDLSGHCTSLKIDIHEPVWYANSSATKTFDIPLNWGDIEKNLNAAISELSKMSRRKPVDEERQKELAHKAEIAAKRLQFDRLKKELEETV